MISHLAILLMALLSLGAAPAAAADKPGALRELKQAVTANPQDPQAHYALGLKFEGLGKTKQAIAEYNKALSLKPDDVKVLYSLGRLMGDTGQVDQAIEIIKKAVKLKPDSAQARSLLAAAYNKQATALMLQGNLDDAKAALQAGLQAKGGPEQTQALLNNLGCLYVRGNQREQAIGTFQDVLRQNPDMAQAHYNLALLYYAQGDYQLASQQMYALKGVDPNMAAELSGYRFRPQTPTDWTPPVKTLVTFPGSPLLTEGTILPYVK